MSRVGLVGAGNIATAMLSGWRLSSQGAPSEISLFDINTELAQRVASTYKVRTVSRLQDLPESAEVLVLCVKPKDVAGALEDLEDLPEGRVVVSVAAGKTVAQLEASLDPGAPVLRLMPNLAMAVGAGVIAYAQGRSLGGELLKKTLALFEPLGTLVALPEAQFDAATALTGSGPGFIALIAEALEDGALALGLASREGEVLARGALHGAAKLILEGSDPRTLRRRVTSPGGTTAAGVAVLERAALRSAITEALLASAKRSRELAEG